MKCSSSEREISIWRCVIRRKRKEQDPRRNLITVIGYIVSSLDHDSARKWTKRTSHEYYTMIFPENGVLLLLELLYNSTINTALPCSLDFFLPNLSDLFPLQYKFNFSIAFNDWFDEALLLRSRHELTKKFWVKKNSVETELVDQNSIANRKSGQLGSTSRNLLIATRCCCRA